jgi:hypothetical protein
LQRKHGQSLIITHFSNNLKGLKRSAVFCMGKSGFFLTIMFAEVRVSEHVVRSPSSDEFLSLCGDITQGDPQTNEWL